MFRTLVAWLAFSTAAIAQTTPVGDWTVGRTSPEEGYFAASINDSGAVLGKYCLAETASCFWVFNNKNNVCEDGSTYPVMVNAAGGAFSASLYCKPLDGKARLIFQDFEAFENGIKGSEQVGLAFPLQSGRFVVSRFNTRRYDAALTALERLSSTLTTPTRSTRDQRL